MLQAQTTVLYPRPIGGRSISIFRMVIVIVVLYLICCGLALGQAVGGNQPPDPNASNPRLSSAPAEPPTRVYGAPVASPQETPSIGALMQKNGGSLLQATLLAAPDADRAKLMNVSLTAVPELQPKLLKKHDLVTIIIHEDAQNSSNGSTTLSKTADFDAKLNNFVQLNLAKMKLTGVAPSVAPELNLQANRDFSGTGAVQREDIVTDRITAEVLDVKPNNTLVLQARKRIKADEEYQEFIMTGICRSEDVAADNTVLSTQCFDLTIQKQNKGMVNTTMKKGVLPKLLDFIDPF